MNQKKYKVFWKYLWKQKIHRHKTTISIEDVANYKIVVFNEVSFSKKKKKKAVLATKMLKKIKPLCVFLPKMSPYGKYFDEIKDVSFLIRDDKFLGKYIEIWGKVSYTIGKEIDSNPVYNKIYIKKNSDEEDSSEEENSSEEEDSVEEDSNEEEDSDKKIMYYQKLSCYGQKYYLTHQKYLSGLLKILWQSDLFEGLIIQVMKKLWKCFMDVKIFNFKIFAFENFLNLGLILPQATHFPTTRDRVLNISDVLNISGFWLWRGYEYARATQG